MFLCSLKKHKKNVFNIYGKKSDDMFSRFDRISACDRQTDGQTDRQTSCDSIVRAMHSIAR